MKRVLYTLSGFAWGIFVANHEAIFYAIGLSIFTLIIDFLVDDEEE